MHCQFKITLQSLLNNWQTYKIWLKYAVIKIIIINKITNQLGWISYNAIFPYKIKGTNKFNCGIDEPVFI